MSKQQPSLPTNRAFVVQFRVPDEETHLTQTGRVEHIRTGQTEHFHTLDQLLAFIEQTLISLTEKHQ